MPSLVNCARRASSPASDKGHLGGHHGHELYIGVQRQTRHVDDGLGYVAHIQGLMVREKPAACFYMGSFFAESLILAETGNAIGAIQIAGTAQPAQLPFFVAACDYTLIGEEFFAASAYLSGEPGQIGSLKGQDIGKLVVPSEILCKPAALNACLVSIDWRWCSARSSFCTPQRG